MSDSHTPVADTPSPVRLARSRPSRSRPSDGRASGTLVAACAGLALVVAPAVAVRAAGEVSSLRIVERPGTPYRYSADGTTYTWGVGRNRLLDGFTSGDREYGHALSADRVELRRDDVSGAVAGERCGLFAERADGAGNLSPDYPGDADGCDVAALLGSRAVNRGALALFAGSVPDAETVERVDYLFDSGILAPVTPEGLERAGHVVAEKGGDDRLKIAAVLSLDVLGQPASYGPPVLVRPVGCMDPALCYGVTDEIHDYAFFGDGAASPERPADGRRASESVAMAFVSSERLGLEAGQRYFGFSLFADDVDTDDHDLLDPATFPDDTGEGGTAADVYGGLSGWFIDESLSNGSGRAFLDENGDGLPNEGEAGLADIQIQLYRDTDGDGVFDPRRDEPVCNATDTDTSGLFVLPGLPDGDYFAVLRENDPELPAGLELGQGANPLPFSIGGGDVDDLHFAFTGGGSDADGATGGATTGGDDAGGDDGGGGDTSGGFDDDPDAGSADAGGDDTGGAGDGDAGAADAGGEDTGGAADGGDDAGTADAGGADTAGTGGGDTNGTAGGGDDAGTADAGGEDTAGGDGDTGSADAGSGDTAGSDDAGTADAGGEDTAGGGDAGATDAGGADTAGAADGGDDAGTADAGGADTTGATDGGDTGNTDAGGDTAGTADGGADAGATDAGGAGTAGTADGGTDAGTTDAGGTGGDPDPGASRDDSPTSAGQDFFDVLQRESADVDVLANDIDGSGGGLTIIRVADPPNGAAEIIDTTGGGQLIRYTPDGEFFGTDAFTYEIRDGDGFERTGTATANVIRFSDIDGNGRNDFLDCNCTDLTLETGVNGSGIGHPSLVLLGLVAVAGALRSRRRRGRSAEGVR